MDLHEIVSKSQEHINEVPRVMQERDLALTMMYLQGAGSHKKLGATYGLTPSGVRAIIKKTKSKALAKMKENEKALAETQEPADAMAG